MRRAKQGKTKPLHPSRSIRSWVVYTAILLGLCCVVTVALSLDLNVRRYVFSLVFAGSVMAIVLFRTRNSDRIARQLMILLVLPAILGFVAYFMIGQSFFMLLGIAGSVAVGVWINYGRMPPYFRAANEQLRAGNTSQALQLVNQSIHARPKSWEAYQLRSVIHFSRKQIVEAEQDARTAIRLNPNFHANHNALGQSLLAQGRFAEAKGAFEKAVRLSPSEPLNHYNLGVACYRLGVYSTVVEAMTTVIHTGLAIEEGNLFARYLLGRSLEALGQVPSAEAAYREMTQFSGCLEALVEKANSQPDYPGTVLARVDLADIERRLNSMA